MNQEMQSQLTALRAVGVPVGDQDRAVDFYVSVLGFEKQMDAPLPQLGGRWIVVAPPEPGSTIALVPAGEGARVGVETGIRLGARDAEAEHERLRAAGVEVGELIRWEGVPPMFTLRDPDGNELTIVEDYE